MIDIASLKKEDIGRWVVYTASHGEQQKGRLKSWSEDFIFVVYNCAGEWDKFIDYTAAPTRKEDLRFTTLSDVL